MTMTGMKICICVYIMLCVCVFELVCVCVCLNVPPMRVKSSCSSAIILSTQRRLCRFSCSCLLNQKMICIFSCSWLQIIWVPNQRRLFRKPFRFLISNSKRTLQTRWFLFVDSKNSHISRYISCYNLHEALGQGLLGNM